METTADLLSLAGLDGETARLVQRDARRVEVPAGSVLFREGGACSGYVIVAEGAVRVQKVAENGREIVLYRVEKGQSCVLTTSCLLGAGAYQAEAIAETDVRLMVLPGAAFQALLGRSEAFRRFVFQGYSARIADLLVLIEEVAFGRIDARLAGWLGQHGSGEGGVAATHQQISVELGTAREVVSRQLKEFERRGWVSLSRSHIAIRNGHALARLAEAARAL